MESKYNCTTSGWQFLFLIEAQRNTTLTATMTIVIKIQPATNVARRGKLDQTEQVYITISMIMMILITRRIKKHVKNTLK